jgi:hypothetical protein
MSKDETLDLSRKVDTGWALCLSLSLSLMSRIVEKSAIVAMCLGRLRGAMSIA